MEEIHIRNVDTEDKRRIMDAVQQFNYPSINQFLLSQISSISVNGSANIYNNLLVEELVDVKRNQSKIIEKLNDIELHEIKLISLISETETLVTNWIRYLEITEVEEFGKEKLNEEK